MQALRKYESVDATGRIQIDIPKEFGGKVEVLVFPIQDQTHLQDTAAQNYFLNTAFEEDANEDAIWAKYVTEKQ